MRGLGLCLALLAALAGCRKDVVFRRARFTPVEHTAVVVRLGVDLGGEKALPREGVVFWDNDTEEPVTIVVREADFDGTLAPGTQGFVRDEERQLLVAGPLPPRGFASLILPAGRYPYAVYAGGAARSEGVLVFAGEAQ